MKITYVIDELGELLEALECLQQLAGNATMRMVAYHLHLARLEAGDILSSLEAGEKHFPETEYRAGGSGGS